MGGTGVIDRFLAVFTQYIDSGFGLLGSEVAFIATTLIVIDVTLAALFWSWGADDDIIARLVKKTLFVGNCSPPTRQILLDTVTDESIHDHMWTAQFSSPCPAMT